MFNKSDKLKQQLKNKKLKTGFKIFLAIWLLIIVGMEFFLTSSVLASLVQNIANEYVDGEIEFSKIKASMIKNFPNLNITIDELSITYPHDKFAKYNNLGVRGKLLSAGRGAEKDTLASFDKLSISINYLTLPFGHYRIRNAEADNPRIFIHCYKDGEANFNIFNISDENETKNQTRNETKNKTKNETKIDDTEEIDDNIESSTEDIETENKETKSELPWISLRRFSLTRNPHIVFTNQQDTIYSSLDMKNLLFNGKLRTGKIKKNRIGLSLDSMFVAGRLPADTLALFVENFNIKEKRHRKMEFDASMKSFLGMSDYGRMFIPIDFNGKFSFPKTKHKEEKIKLEEFNANIATIPLSAMAEVIFKKDSTYIMTEAEIDECKIRDIVDFCGENFFPAAKDYDTDGRINFIAICDGYYVPKRNALPPLLAELDIPRSTISKKGFDNNGYFDLNAYAETDENGKLNLHLNNANIDFNGLLFSGTAGAQDLNGIDPSYNVKGEMHASLDSLIKIAIDSSDFSLSGNIKAQIDGQFKQSQLSLYNFAGAKIAGLAACDTIEFRTNNDSLKTYLAGAQLNMNASEIKLQVDSLEAIYGFETFIKGKNIKASAGNDNEFNKYDKTHQEHPFIGNLKIENLEMMSEDSLYLQIKNSKSIFKIIREYNEKAHIPILSINSKNKMLYAKSGENRIKLEDADFYANAKLNSFEKSQRKKAFLDSLQRVYPGLDRDSLINKLLIDIQEYGKDLEDLSEEDFKKHDIHINLSESAKKYIEEWDIYGNMHLRAGRIITPYFPLDNRIEKLSGKFNNNKVNLENLTFKSGKSDISATGILSGISDAILKNKGLKLRMNITSNVIDANELLASYSIGSKFAEDANKFGNLNDAEYLKHLEEKHKTDSLENYSMIVIPANLDTKISLEANRIDYSKLMIDWMASDIAMNNRCLQITNTVATSNMGDIYFEGYYSTTTKNDIQAGFDLNMADITAEKVIELIPAVDSIMPMLKSFKGNLDCEMAATSRLDTNMNFIPSSINGVMNISGRKLILDELGGFKKVARLLMFRNKKKGIIGDMSVSGIINNSELEIFPFVMHIDRYTLAMSGKQSFDQDFRYHVSVLKSPIPFRFGINVFGNFDRWKYRLGKARYKNTNVPVFTTQVDNVRKNLVNSIHDIFNKGVQKAMKEHNSAQSSIEDHKKQIGYDSNFEIDSLDTNQLHQMDSLIRDFETPKDSLQKMKMPTDSLQKRTMPTDSLQKMTIPTDSLQKMEMTRDTLQKIDAIKE